MTDPAPTRSGPSKESQLTTSTLWRAAVAATLIVIGLLLMMYPERVHGQEPTTASIEIRVDTDPESDAEFCFDIQVTGPDPDDFCREDNEDFQLLNLSPGRVIITVVDVERGWELDTITCTPTDPDVDYNTEDSNVEIFVQAGDRFVCEFDFNRSPTPTPTASPVPPAPTGTPVPTQAVVIVTATPTPPAIADVVATVVKQLATPVVAQPVSTPPSAVAIRPPSTGDGGLVREGQGYRAKAALVAGFGASFFLVLFARAMARR